MRYTDTIVDFQGNESMLPVNDTSDTQSGANADTKDEVKKDAQKEADKKAKDSLTGVVQLVPHAGYSAKTVWYLGGLSNIFDGDYYFKQVTHKISKNSGYSVSARVVKNELGGDKEEKTDERREVANLNSAGSWV